MLALFETQKRQFGAPQSLKNNFEKTKHHVGTWKEVIQEEPEERKVGHAFVAR